MLPIFPHFLAVRAAITLFDSLGLASLGGCLPLPLPLRGSRAFAGCRVVLGTRSLDVPEIFHGSVLPLGTSFVPAGGM